MKPNQIREIISTYQKYDWIPREFLFSETESATRKLKKELENVEFREASIDAIWFSRPPKNGVEAWELRILSGQPLALFEKFPAGQGAAEQQKTRKAMETRLAEMTSKTLKKSG